MSCQAASRPRQPTLDRRVVHEHRDFARLVRYSPRLRFRVASYNVLAPSLALQSLYPTVEPDVLDWRRRKGTILREILHYKPCVIALQELEAREARRTTAVDDSTVVSRLHEQGYETEYIVRTAPGKSDGCCLAWKRDVWALVEYVPVWYHLTVPRFMNRGNVGQVALLRHSASGRHVLLANTHLLFNPRRGDIKLGQLFVLLQLALECRNRHSLTETDAPLLLVGDFNASPCSAVWDYLFSSREAGSLPLGGEIPARAAGLLGAATRLRMNVARDDPTARGSFLSGWFWRKNRRAAGLETAATATVVTADGTGLEPEESGDDDGSEGDKDADPDSEATTGPVPVTLAEQLRPPQALDTGSAYAPWPAGLTLTHPFGQLTSVYAIHGRGRGSHTGEPPCTTLHSGMQTCVDYMGVGKGLISTSRLELPVAAEIHRRHREGGLPCAQNGSDHFLLMADFTWPDRRSHRGEEHQRRRGRRSSPSGGSGGRGRGRGGQRGQGTRKKRRRSET